MTGKHDSPLLDLDELTGKQKGQLVSRHIYLSHNSKTGVSINSRIQPARVSYAGLCRTIPGSCRPTKWCQTGCYARKGHFATWNRDKIKDLSVQQRKYLVNSVLFSHYASAPQEQVDQEADSLVGEALQRGYNNIRWNGGGDFSIGAVRLVNSITQRHPNFVIWGFSKRADMLQKLEPRPNLILTVSLDPTTPLQTGQGDSLSSLVSAAVRHGGRMALATDIPSDPYLPVLTEMISQISGGLARLNVVFGYHSGAMHTKIGSRVECPSTSGDSDAGCQKCRWCFTGDKVYQKLQITTPRQSLAAQIARG